MPARPQGARVRALIHTVLPAFVALVLVTSALVTGSLGGTTRPAAALAGSPSATAIRYALGELGHPYRYGGSGPSAFDCSGLTMAAYRTAGFALPHSARAQYAYGTTVFHASWRPGDLIFWSSNGRATGIYHVGIYLGGWRVLHAPSTGRVVQIEPIWSHGLLPYGKRLAASSTPLLTVTTGAVGDRVKAVQQRLRAQGYTSVAVSGRFDYATQLATRRFQAKERQRVDGSVGWNTWSALVVHGSTARVS